MVLWWVLACVLGTADEDGDGWSPADGDCDDTRAEVNPGADEVCDTDQRDEDCDGTPNGADAVDAAVYYLDLDGDGAAGTEVWACEAPEGAVEVATDCDDGNAGRHPDAAELCNDLDDDCDDQPDEGLTDRDGWLDQDGDSYGEPNAPVSGCRVEDGSVDNGDDCDDDDATVNPGAPEDPGNTVDENCDGVLVLVDDSFDDGAVDDPVAERPGWLCEEAFAAECVARLTDHEHNSCAEGGSPCLSMKTDGGAQEVGVFTDEAWQGIVTLDFWFHDSTGGTGTATVIFRDRDATCEGARLTVSEGWSLGVDGAAFRNRELGWVKVELTVDLEGNTIEACIGGDCGSDDLSETCPELHGFNLSDKDLYAYWDDFYATW